MHAWRLDPSPLLPLGLYGAEASSIPVGRNHGATSSALNSEAAHPLTTFTSPICHIVAQLADTAGLEGWVCSFGAWHAHAWARRACMHAWGTKPTSSCVSCPPDTTYTLQYPYDDVSHVSARCTGPRLLTTPVLGCMAGGLSNTCAPQRRTCC